MKSAIKSIKANGTRFLIFVLVAFTFVICASPLEGTAQETLKIGVIGTLSGAGTAWGIATKRAVEIAVDEVNSRGGLKVGGKRYRLETVIYDDRYTGQGGTSAAQRLIYEDKVTFIIGPTASPVALASGLITNREKVIQLGCGYTPKMLGPDKPYTFRDCMTNYETTPPNAAWVAQQYPNAKKVVVLTPNDEIGHSAAPLTVSGLEGAGFKEVISEHFEPGTVDFVPVLTRIMAKNPDIIEMDGNPPGYVALIVKQARQLGYKGLLSQISGGPSLNEVLEVAGPQLAEGFLSLDQLDLEDPYLQGFLNAYKKKYGENERVNPFAPVHYNSCRVLFDAIERANSLDTDKVKIALENSDGFIGVYGPIKWTGEKKYGIRHQILTPFYLKQIKDGKFVTVKKITP
jgi:branched-chain amino acid transport system substrate-binding protein